jgi:hypothetical protein
VEGWRGEGRSGCPVFHAEGMQTGSTTCPLQGPLPRDPLLDSRPMSASPAGPTPGAGGYIRGGGGVEIRTRRVVDVVAAGCVALLVALVAALSISASHQNAQLTTLRHHGVPVEVTVSGCLGISSGIGMGIEYWQCRGSYALAGQNYNEVLRGSRTLLEAGQQVAAVAVPGQPALVTTAAAVGKSRSAWTPYVAPALLGLAAIAVILGWVLLSRRSRRSRTA